ncbi:MAG TPA: hypothetical protein VJB94_03485 [Candidatus Nanoarchaeia archaeon]|nr:hypothetical protein [Candidatus Nanoarchaeia archaeon]
MLFNKTEVKHLVVSALVLGFVFGFDDGRSSFMFSYWILNFLKFALFSLIVLVVQELGQKLIASRSGCTTEHRVWKIKRYGFSKSREFSKLPFGIESLYLGFILPILIVILSSGQLKFAAVGLSLISINPMYRLGRKYTHLTDFETAKIALTGPLTAMLFALILKMFPATAITTNLIVISTAFALSNIIPLPKLDGAETFFGSKPLFVFGAAFIIGCYYLIIYLHLFTALILSLMIAAILLVLYYYYVEFT